MTVRNVKKNLAGQQDLLPGVGPYNQIRRGVTMVMHGPARSYFDLFVRSYAEAGLPVKGTFEDGCTLVTVDDIAIHLAEGLGYSYSGTLPKVIAAGENPSSNPLWTVRSVDSFRAQIAGPQGSSHVGFQQDGAGSVPRTAQDKMRERITPPDFGAIGDGVTNDQAAFAALEASFSGQEIDLLGKTYAVTSQPVGNKYFNGEWIIGGSPSRARYQGAQLTGAGRVVFGDGALGSLPLDYGVGENGLVMAIGPNALGKATQVKSAIAIGNQAMGESIISRDNIAIGGDALKYVQAISPNHGPFPGTRLVAIGSNSFRHVSSGNRGVAIGRNAGQAITTGIRITAVGSGAMSSYCPIDWTGQITNPTPVTASEMTAYGADSLALCNMNENTGIGTFAGSAIKAADGNWFGGSGAGRLLDSDLSNANKVLDLTARTGTYSISGSTVTVNSVGVNAIVGNRVRLKTTTGPIPIGESVDVVVVSAPTVDQFTFTCPISGSGSGDVTIDYVETAATRTPSRWNTLTGARCGELSTHMQECTLSGYSAGKSFQGTSLTLYGWGAGFNITGGTFSSGFGHAAMRYMQDGSNTISVNNSTCLGANSRVSGDNQVQLGDGNTTTYVYGTVQNRSDARDKTDYDDTVLGIEFIMGLRPVDGRWDMRDDYWEEYDEQVGVDAEGWPVFETKRRQIPKDGSRARQRKHHWFIAQEVKELCDKLGVDFGGYQDHSVNGGCDVLTLGYDEFIPPTVKAVQQCWTRLDELEKRIAKLE